MFEKYKVKNENNNKEIIFTEREIKDEIIKKNIWKNRRYMSWISFFILIFIIIFTAFNSDISAAQVDIFKYFGFFFSSIVLAYIGGNVIERIKDK